MWIPSYVLIPLAIAVLGWGIIKICEDLREWRSTSHQKAHGVSK